MPFTIRSSFLVLFCAVTLTILILLQVAASSFQFAQGSYETSMSASHQAPVNASSPVGLGALPVSSYPVFTFFASVDPGNYFHGAYLPTMMGILYGMLWEMSDVRLMQMEPFFQLTAPGGADATDSLVLNYVSASLPVVLLRSIKEAHRAVF